MAALFLIAIVTLTFKDIVETRRMRLDEARSHASLLHKQVERQLDGTIAAVDQALQRLIDILRRHPEWRTQPGRDLHAYLKQVDESLPIVISMLVVDRSGTLVESSLDPPIRSFLAVSRPYFAYHRDTPNGGLYVGPLLVGQTSGRWTFPISRRLSTPGGEFDGVVLAGLSPTALAAEIDWQDHGGHHRIRTYLTDGHLLTQPHSGVEPIGALESTYRDLWASGAATSEAAIVRREAKAGRTEHHHLKATTSKAFLIDIAFTQEDVLKDWRQGLVFRLSILAAAILLVAALSFLLVREINASAIANAALGETVARFQRMEGGSNLGFWEIDFRTGARYFSPAWLSRLGLDASPPPPGGYALLWETRFHPDDRHRVLERVQALIDHDTPLALEHRVIAADGSTLWVRVAGELERDESGLPTFLSGTVLDISERKKLEMALMTSESRLAEAQRVAGLGYWEWRIDRDDLWWSNEVYRIFGVDADAFRPSYSAFLDRVHAEDRDRVSDAVNRALLARGRYAVDHRLIRPDGSERVVSEQGLVLLSSRGEPDRIIGTVLDITDRVRAERDLTHASRLTALGELAANLAHEMGQPLAAIKLSVGNALIRLERGTASQDDHRRIYETIDDQVQRLYETIEQVRQFSRRENTPPSPFSACAAVQAAITMLKAQFESSRIAIDCDVGGTNADADLVLGHAGRLQQVIVNLLLNARDAILEVAPEGGTIRVSCANDRAAGLIRIAVENEGSSIPQAILDRIFEPFFTTKSAEKGTGIGLSISLGIVAGMGGRIDVLNIAGGVRFEINLPCSAQAVGPIEPPRMEPEPPVGENAHILIVEDDSLTRTLLSEFLHFRGYRVSAAANGHQALDVLERSAIDLILTDLAMPGMGGEELLRRLEAGGGDGVRPPPPPAIVMTANPLTQARQAELTALGARHILRKPLSNNALLATIAATLKRD
jgi:PAS domain S-box-containing protein